VGYRPQTSLEDGLDEMIFWRGSESVA